MTTDDGSAATAQGTTAHRLPAVVDFADRRAVETELVGGKGAGLARTTQAGFAVPPGFCITSAAFLDAVDDEQGLRDAAVAGDVATARAIVAATDPPAAAIASALADLPAGAVAVRSSACAEDSADASYAGQQETFLDVEGEEAVLAAVRDCWLSFFSDRAMFYREQKGSLEDVGMAVVVQRMVAAQSAGVLFTVDPVHRRRDRMVVEAARGLGEQVVSGEVTPDHYRLDRRGQVKNRRIVGDEPVLGDDQLGELATLGRDLAELYGCPQDVEWAFDDDGLHLLQARPVTTM